MTRLSEDRRAIDTTTPTFIVSDGPDAVVVAHRRPIARLAEGRRSTGRAADQHRCEPCSALGRDGARLLDRRRSGDPTLTFTPVEGAHDVDLVRDVLDVNDALLHADVSAFIVVTEGSVASPEATLEGGSRPRWAPGISR